MQYTVNEDRTTYDRLDRVCAMAHFRNAVGASNARACRIRWVASQVWDDANLDFISIERFTAAEPVGAGNPVVMGPITDAIHDQFSAYFNLFESRTPTEVYAFDLVCTGMDPGDQVLRYRFDFDFKKVGWAD
jgi:hypothetical protein